MERWGHQVDGGEGSEERSDYNILLSLVGEEIVSYSYDFRKKAKLSDYSSPNLSKRILHKIPFNIN